MEKIRSNIKLFFKKNPEPRPDVASVVNQMVAKSLESTNRVDHLPSNSVDAARTREISIALQRSVDTLLKAWVMRHPEFLTKMRLPQIETMLTRSGRLTAPAKRAVISSAFTGSAAPPLRERDEAVLGPEETFLPRVELRLLFNISAASIVDSEELATTMRAIKAFLAQSERSINHSLSESGFKVKQVDKTIHLVIEGARNCATKIMTAPADNANNDNFLIEFISEIRDAIKVQDDGMSYTPSIHRALTLGKAITDQETMPIIVVAADEFVSSRYLSAEDKPIVKKELLTPDAADHAKFLNIVGISKKNDGDGYYICPIKKTA